jgi:hypothetical protein
MTRKLGGGGGRGGLTTKYANDTKVGRERGRFDAWGHTDRCNSAGFFSRTRTPTRTRLSHVHTFAPNVLSDNTHWIGERERRRERLTRRDESTAAPVGALPVHESELAKRSARAQRPLYYHLGTDLLPLLSVSGGGRGRLAAGGRRMKRKW